ncbi:MAG TPA: calcium/sodium antiporter, partial [Gammaproteobacteria bacterium]|nr:calcium/sodium antiporter [Gammaproteobacteria bacterium]
GFALLVWGADRFVHGAAATARNLGVSPLIIGLTIVGVGTSAPEILVSTMAALQGNPSLAVGNAVGSNIANIALVLGATALISPLRVKSETLSREYPMMFAVMLLTLVLMLDYNLSRLDGFVLLGALAVMLYWMISLGLRKHRRDPMEADYEKEIPVGMPTARAAAWTLLGLLVLLGASRLLVWAAVDVAQAFGVSDLVIGLTVVAIGTSLPELAASIVSALKKQPDIAIGNIIGSNIFNLLAVIGLPTALAPHALDPAVLTRDMPVMIGLSIALFAMAYGFRGQGCINRIEGALLVLAYFAYLTLLYYNNAAH